MVKVRLGYYTFSLGLGLGYVIIYLVRLGLWFTGHYPTTQMFIWQLPHQEQSTLTSGL